MLIWCSYVRRIVSEDRFLRSDLSWSVVSTVCIRLADFRVVQFLESGVGQDGRHGSEDGLHGSGWDAMSSLKERSPLR